MVPQLFNKKKNVFTKIIVSPGWNSVQSFYAYEYKYIIHISTGGRWRENDCETADINSAENKNVSVVYTNHTIYTYYFFSFFFNIYEFWTAKTGTATKNYWGCNLIYEYCL